MESFLYEDVYTGKFLDSSANKEITEELNRIRNKDPVDTIREFIDAGENVVVVVGASLLTGDDSVIEYLKNEGYLRAFGLSLYRCSDRV